MANPETLEQGRLSVSTENIFPIIKKSLYSDHDIFLRELVANSVDATEKLKFLANRGEVQGELGELKIEIKTDEEVGTLTVSDHGIGMTAAEVKQYLNQVAFSGAAEFLKKYEEASDSEAIIGKFGLGFYSAFMVAKRVEVVTKSYQEGAAAVRWSCEGSVEYTLESAEKEERGTDVILYLNEDDRQYAEQARVRTILQKYTRFLPVPIFLGEEQVNNTDPVWRKAPSDLSDEDYLNFFRELYPFNEEPLFWIHLNVDYPFNLTGVLYFPRIRRDIDPRKNGIQLYSRQMFITDEVKDIVPEYLMLLQGVIDSPDIPLNVSRSYLQGDPRVRKISAYITKKVADKLRDLYREDADAFAEKWDDISTFVKYGMMTDDKFHEKAMDFCLVKNTEGERFALESYREKIAPLQTDKDEQVVHLYTSDSDQQHVYVNAARQRNYDVLVMDGVIDTAFIGHLERKQEKVRWARVDADTPGKLIPKEGEDSLTETQLQADVVDRLKAAFEAARPGAHIEISLARLDDEALPVVITRNEFMRRFQEQSEMMGGNPMGGAIPDTLSATINTAHPLVAQLAEQEEPDAGLTRHLLDLGLLSQGLLKGSALTDFIARSIKFVHA